MSVPETLADVAATGNRRATLEALRDHLATAIDAGPPARDLAALSRRLLEVITELEKVPEVPEMPFVDTLPTPRSPASGRRHRST